MPLRIAHAWSTDGRIDASEAYDVVVRARGHEVVYFTPDGPSAARARAAGVEHHVLPMTRQVDPWGDLAGFGALVAALRAHPVDVLHTHNTKVGIVARAAGVVAGVPVLVHTVHGLPFDGRPARASHHAFVWAERLVGRRTAAVFTQSEEDTEVLRRLGVVPPARLVFVGNGVALDRFDPALHPAGSRAALRRTLGVDPGAYLVVCASRLRVDKGIEELVDAALALRGRGSRVVVALAGTRDADGLHCVSVETLERARRGGVLVLGHRDDIPALYAAADAVALPSWHEGLPRALVEGAALGKPLVATDVCGCREVLRAPMVGRLVPVRDARALAAALDDLARDPDAAARAAVVNRAEAVARFDVRRVATDIADTYESLAETARRG